MFQCKPGIAHICPKMNGIQAYIHNRLKGRQTEIQTERQREKDRGGRETDRQTHTQTNR